MNNCDIPSDGKKEKSHAGKGVDRGRVAGEAPLRAPACLVRLSTLSLAPPGQLGGLIGWSLDTCCAISGAPLLPNPWVGPRAVCPLAPRASFSSSYGAVLGGRLNVLAKSPAQPP